MPAFRIEPMTTIDDIRTALLDSSIPDDVLVDFIVDLIGCCGLSRKVIARLSGLEEDEV